MAMEVYAATVAGTRILVMWKSGFSLGDRVRRVNDGAVGVVAEIGPMGSIGVRWDSSGVVSIVVPAQIQPA
jgi:hypothetical protein